MLSRRSYPSSCRAWAIASGEALLPTNARTGSAGLTCCSTKSATVRKKRTSRPEAARRRTYLLIPSLVLQQAAQAVAAEIGDQREQHDAGRGHDGDPPVGEEVRQSLRGHRAKLRRRGGAAQSQERETGEDDDGASQVQGERDQ